MGKNLCIGTVTETLGSLKFKVLKENGTEVLAYLAGKMAQRKIWVYVGDKVEMVVPDYGTLYRIVHRF